MFLKLFSRASKSLGVLLLTFALNTTGLGLTQELAPVRLFERTRPAETLQQKVETTPEAPIRLSTSLSIHPYENSPLAGRTPLVLVHGIGGDANYYHWGHFLDFTKTKLDFQKRYKIYLVHYNSAYSVTELSGALSDTLREFVKVHGNRPIRVLAYSEGGLLTRNAMQDPFLEKHTEQVITIATPFHGSPLANPAWFEKHLKTEPPLSPLRMTYKMAYWVARKQHPSFETDFHWDNFDQAIAAQDFEKAYGRRGELKAYALEQKDNFITYGSFFGENVDNDDRQMTQALELKQPLSDERPKLVNLFRKNVLFSVVQRSMATLPHAITKKQAEAASDAQPEDTSVASLPGGTPQTVFAQVMVTESLADAAHEVVEKSAPHPALRKPNPMHTSDPAMAPLMLYNDGISPISSTLWLGRFTPRFKEMKTPVEQAWAALKSLKGQRVARLFHGLDHRNWMEGETRHDSDRVKDLLNPNEPPRTVFEWLVHDLMTG